MASIDLMIERYSRIRQEEESKNGLIILAAVYGKMIDGMLDLIIRSSDFYYFRFCLLTSTFIVLDSFNFDLDTNGNVLIELDDVLIRDMSPASDEPNDTVKYRPINLSGNQLSGMNLHINTKLTGLPYDPEAASGRTSGSNIRKTLPDDASGSKICLLP